MIDFYYGTTAVATGNYFANSTDNNGNLRRQMNFVPLAGGGNVVPQVDDYTYDALNRISSFTEGQMNSSGQWMPNVAWQNFSYDPYGNRKVTGASGGVSNYNPDYDTVNNTNRIMGLGYDAAGNITFDPLTGGTMIYDAESRLLTASAGGGRIYTYDASGKRTRRTEGGQETWHVYGIGGELLAEYAANAIPSAPQKEYGYRGGQLLIIAESGSGGGTSFVKPDSQSKSDLIGKIGAGAGGAANRIFSAVEPFTALGIDWGYGSINAGFSDNDGAGTPVRGGPRAPAEEYGNAPSANGISESLLAEHPAGAQPAAPQKAYGARREPSIVTAQSSSVVTVNPGANQTPDPGLGGEAVSSQTNLGHGSETSSAFRGTKGFTSRTKSCLWHSFPGVSGGTKTRVALKFDWTLIASVNVSVFEESFASATADYDFRIEYSLDNGSTWTGRVGLTDSISMDAPGSDGRSINTSGSELVDLPNPGAVDITRIRVRDRIYASAALANSPDGSASGITTATVSNIRLEVEIVDDIAPVITGVSSSAVTHNSTTISWSTNENSDSQVEYRTDTGSWQTTALNPALVTAHSQGLSGLAEGTLYHYRVKSRDAAGNLAISEDFTFTTADITAPVISTVAAVDITTTGATITWSTNENSDSQVEYRTDTGSWQPTALNPARVTAHLQGLSGLMAGTLYHYRVKSKDAAGNLTTSAEFTFTTAQNGSSGIKWLVTDHLGSTRMVIDETGSLAGIKRRDYCPFGEELSAGVGIRTAALGYGDDGIRQKFDGYERDSETTLDFAQARYYSSIQGRFTSVDPLHSSAIPDDPQSWNRYSFVGNRPLIYIDPTGLQWGRSNETGEYKWFGDTGGVVPDGWEKVSIGTEYVAIDDRRVVLQAGGIWDYVRPPQQGINVFADTELTNSMMKLWGGSVLLGGGLGVGVAGGSVAATDLFPMATQMAAAMLGIGNEETGGTILSTTSSGGGETLKRLGVDPESTGRLARKAAEAEAVIGIHGVSVTAGEAEGPHSSASRSSVEEHFKVHNTPTRRDPLHRTVEFPKPVTPQTAKTFNRIFGRIR